MKLAKISYAPTTESSDCHWNLILESRNDVLNYFEYESAKHSRAAMDFWFLALKRENQNDGHANIDRLSHFIGGDSNSGYRAAALHILQTRLLGDDNGLTIQKYCFETDKLISNKFSFMISLINNGPIKVNMVGGYSRYDNNYFEFESIDCDQSKMIQYLSGKNFLDNGIVDIKNKTLVIENDNKIEDKVLKFLTKKKLESDYYLMNNFRDVLADKKTFEKTILNAINNGLENLVVMTTLTDKSQFEDYRGVFESILKTKPNKTVIFYLIRNGFQDKIKTKLNNFPIKLIN